MYWPCYKPSKATPSTDEMFSFNEETDAETLDITEDTDDTDADKEELLESNSVNASCRLFAEIFPEGVNGIADASVIGVVRYPGIILLYQ